MDISLLTNATSPDYMSAVTQKTLLSVDTDESFDSVLSSAINMLNETNDLQNDSQSAKIQFALGEAGTILTICRLRQPRRMRRCSTRLQ